MSKPTSFTRRQFMQSSTAGLTLASASVLGANDTIRLALIGCSGQGVFDLQECLKAPKTKAVALCDVDQTQLNKAAQSIGGGVETTGDFRRILDRKDVDAVIIATPDHWHAIPAIQATQAGKDVYLEKPIGHTIREGQLLTQAARDPNRIVSVGLQQRTGTLFLQAQEIIRSGQLGKISLVHCWNAWNDKVNYNAGYRQLKKVQNSPPPAGVDYDFWLGPAPKREFNQNRYNGTYLYYWDYSGGMTITWGVHLIDTVMQLMNVKAPMSVTASGGKYVFDDDRDTPDTVEQVFDFPGFTLTYSCRHASAFPSGSAASDHGIQFFGAAGAMLLNRAGYQIITEEKKPQSTHSPAGLEAGWGAHQRNFIECLNSRRAPNCTMIEGHRSTTACQLANIAYRTGHKIRWDADKEQIIGDAEATRLMTKQYRAPWSLR
ncbi:MAG TPA: Gfo/Idh/MocA family oxidoreductase [Blastocatellia bacterium]|nr:Gfo/Idh/MocA family oxidoreductase [Blastocatellia bacterium]